MTLVQIIQITWQCYFLHLQPFYVTGLASTKLPYHDDMLVGQFLHKQTKKSSLGHNR